VIRWVGPVPRASYAECLDDVFVPLTRELDGDGAHGSCARTGINYSVRLRR